MSVAQYSYLVSYNATRENSNNCPTSPPDNHHCSKQLKLTKPNLTHFTRLLWRSVYVVLSSYLGVFLPSTLCQSSQIIFSRALTAATKCAGKTLPKENCPHSVWWSSSIWRVCTDYSFLACLLKINLELELDDKAYSQLWISVETLFACLIN